jgi:hypothetical protein
MRLIAGEDFIKFSHCESSRSYIKKWRTSRRMPPCTMSVQNIPSQARYSLCVLYCVTRWSFIPMCVMFSVKSGLRRFITGRIWDCIQTFPDWVGNEINNNNKNLLRSNTKGYGDKTHWTDSQNTIQLHLLAESCTICSSRSRRPVRKLLDTESLRFYNSSYFR